MEEDKAETCDEPLHQQVNWIVTTGVADVDQQSTEEEEQDVDSCHARVVSVPLVLDLLRSFRVQVQLLWGND